MQRMLEVMWNVEHFIFGPFQTNTYVVHGEDHNALLIDPACCNPYEQQELMRFVQTKNLHIQAIIATHGHLDHLWGAKWACEQWSMPVKVHKADIPMVKAMQQQYDLFGIRATAQSFQIEPLTATHSSFTVLHTPGHTPGSICLYWSDEHLLLSGDTLFRMGYGRTDLPGGDMNRLITSLQKLMELPPETRVYPGHGDDTTIAEERRGLI